MRMHLVCWSPFLHCPRILMSFYCGDQKRNAGRSEKTPFTAHCDCRDLSVHTAVTIRVQVTLTRRPKGTALICSAHIGQP